MLQKSQMCPSFLKIVPILLLVLFLSATIAEVPEVFLRPQNPFKEHEEPKWVKEIKKQLEKRLSFDFVDTPLTNVVAFLQNLAGCNMVIDPAVLEGMGPKITLKVTDMKLEPALKWILRLADLDFELKDEVIFITKWDKQALHLYEVSELIQLVKQDGAEGKDGLTPLRLISFIKGAIKPATWKKAMSTKPRTPPAIRTARIAILSNAQKGGSSGPPFFVGHACPHLAASSPCSRVAKPDTLSSQCLILLASRPGP